VTTDDITQLGGDIIGGDIQNNFVLTRLHARYGKKDMKDDLVFREATPVTGGREEWSRAGLEYGVTPSEKNFFQGRYAIRHAWSGPIKCKHPQRYVWGASPDGNDSETLAASKLAFVPRGKLDLSSVIGRDLWEIGYKKARKGPSTRTKAMGGGALLLLGLGAFLLRRRRP
jgi:MYXO-CTERM domain-containing protein